MDKPSPKPHAPAPEPEMPPEQELPLTATPVNAEEIEGRFELAPTLASDQVFDYAGMTAQLEAREKWINSVLHFVIRRTYAGDWVSHDKMSVPMEDRTVNMSGAAAERIVRDLGIQEINRTKPVKVMSQEHAGHYKYVCEADYVFNKNKVHAIGLASTLNPFYSKAHGNDKDPGDIREEYILRDAWRDCTKQAIKGMLGLRKIPIMKLEELGYNITKVKFVNFKEEGGGEGSDKAKATAVPGQEMTVTIKAVLPRAYDGKDIIDVLTTKGEKLSWWGKSVKSKETIDLQQFALDGWQVTFKYTQKGNYKNIQEIVEAVPQ